MRSSIKPRRFIVAVSAVAIVALATSCGGNAPKPATSPGTPVTFQWGYQTGTSSASLQLIAKSDGFFDKENIDFKLVPANSTGTIVAGVTNRSIDGAMVALSTTAQTRQKGVKVTMLGGFTASPRGLAVPVKDTSTPYVSGNTVSAFAPTLKALVGKTVGVPGLGGALPKELDALGKLAGIPAGSFKYIDVEPGTPVIAALKTATVDAVYEPLLSTAQAEAAGYSRTVMTTNNAPDSLSKSLLIGNMVNEAYLAEHPDFPERYQRAITLAVKVFNDPAQRQHVVDVLAANGVKFTTVDGTKFLSQTPAFATLPKSLVVSSLQFMFDAGVIPAEPKVNATDLVVPRGLS
jgi:ABC-type nitrate/sulfonate/bicarbonate transport system substrate-binding protein